MTTQIKPQGLVRRMEEHDLSPVLEWRNDPKVREHMFTRHEISATEHRAWFDRASADPSRHLLIFEIDSVRLGFVNYQAPGSGPIAEWGFFLSPAAPKGTGPALGNAALAHGFGALGFHKVCGEVLAANVRSVRFHLRLGFTQEGVLRDQHFDGSTFHNVVRFGLLQHEWAPLASE
jgi:UDP-4-amino-4,6-dideoxy-N-acetyl-beta-L-altrosamine N-acetyltransferase